MLALDRIKKEVVMSKPAELREQTDEQLELTLREVQTNLFRLRLQSETERLEAPSEIIKAKREVARIKTILRLREIENEKTTATATASHA
jgi:large subunit ribosomal protein L29